jgi:hypothetical protein
LAALVALYFVATSGAFLKAVVVPRVGAALGSQVAVGEVALSPFSSIELRQVAIQTGGAEPMVQAERVLLRYRVFGLLRGEFAFPEIVVEAPVLRVVERPDGTRNVDVLLGGDTNAPVAATRAEPLRMQLGRVVVTRGTVTYRREAKDGSTQTSEVSALDFGAENLANGQTGKVKLSAALAQAYTPARGPAGAAAATNGAYRVEARVDGGLDLRLEKDLRPSQVKGEVRLDVAKATGGLRDLGGVTGVLACEATPTEIKELALRVERGGQKLGSARVTGPIDLKKSEARLKVDVSSIDRNVLNLAGAPFGLDFAATTLNASGMLDMARRGEMIALSVRATLAKFSVRQGGLGTPELDVTFDCQSTVSLGDKSAVVHRLTLTGVQGGRELLALGLDRAMNLAWGNTIHGLNESRVNLVVNGFRLTDWRPFLGTNIPSGVVDVTAKLTCQDDGQRFSGDIGVGVREIEWAFPGVSAGRTNAAAPTAVGIHGGTFNLTTRLSVRDYRSILLEQYSLQFAQGGTALLTASGSASYDRVSADGSVQAAVEVPIPALLVQFPVAGLSASAGKLGVDGLISKEKGQTRVGFNVNLAGFAGAYADLRFDRYEARLGLDGEITDKYANLRRLQMLARQGLDPFGGLEASGKYDRLLDSGEFALNIENLTASGLQPLLAPFLAPRQWAAGRLAGSGNGRYDARGTNTLQLQLEAQSLLVRDPSGAVPETPLNLQLGLDAGYRSNVVNLGRLALTLPSSQRAPRNQLIGQGTLDLRRTNALAGEFKIVSDALDLTWLAEAYRTNRPAGGLAHAPTTEPGSGGTGPAAVPPPAVLPIESLTTHLQLARLYLGEVAVSNWTATLNLSRNAAQLDPFKLAMGSGSLSASARADLAKPGYEYALDLRADRLPLAPLVNTFAPDRRDQFKGELGLALQVKGAGLTEANLRKNLAAQFDLGATNLSLALGNVRSSVLKTLVSVVLEVPQLARNPTAALGNVLGQLTGGSASRGGWVDDLAKAPIDTVAGRGKVGQGRIELEQTLVRSPAFRAEATGAVTLEPVLTNSTLHLPVHLALRRELAESVGAAAPAAPAGEAYARLPDFLTIEGTLGNAKAKLDKVALATLAVRSGAGLLGNTGNANLDKAAGVLNSVGSALGALGGTANAGTSTQAVSGAGLLNSVTGLLGTPAATRPAAGTNAPAAGTNAPAARTKATSNLLETVTGLFGARGGTPVTNRPGTGTAPGATSGPAPAGLSLPVGGVGGSGVPAPTNAPRVGSGQTNAPMTNAPAPGPGGRTPSRN